MVNEDFLKQLDRLKLVNDRKVNAHMAGQKESLMPGQGLIFKDRAQYTPGEDFRHIDWQVLARTDKLFVRHFESEKNLTVHILVDYSGSMQYGTQASKSSYAAMLALGFAYMANKDGERFSISTFSDSIEPVRPRRGMAQMASVFEYLNTKRPKGKTSYSTSLMQYAKRISSSSMVVVISDFLYDLKDIEEALWAFSKHQLIVVQVLDPTERHLTLEGDVNLKDLETGAVMHTYITKPFRNNYAKQLDSHIINLAQVCISMRAKFYSLSVNDPVFDFFYSLFGR